MTERLTERKINGLNEKVERALWVPFTAKFGQCVCVVLRVSVDTGF